MKNLFFIFLVYNIVLGKRGEAMKVCVMSLGCKVNIYESEYVISLLKDNGFEIVNDDKKADIYIINTCSVTNESDRKSRKLIHHARRENKDAIIVVMG